VGWGRWSAAEGHQIQEPRAPNLEARHYYVLKMNKIATEADVESALSQPLAIVYKHSPICPTSGIAYEEIRLLRHLHADVPVYLLDVVQSRPLSRYIAERFGIVHASPQAIILRAGVPAWHGSHFDLRAEVIARRLASLKAETPELEDPA
jgi:bacillithiol system protein YtxJ